MAPDAGDPADLQGRLAEAAHRFGTPLYVTELAAVERAAEQFETTFADGWTRQYSLKANHLPALVARLAVRGWGANVVSPGEWRAARAAGVPNSRISLEGIGKTDAVLRAVVDAAASGAPLAWVALESAEEAIALQQLARDVAAGTPVDVLLRLNPAVRPDTLAGLAVGRRDSKFGMPADDLVAVARMLDAGPLRLRGVHVHVGSQLRSSRAWTDGVLAAVRALDRIGGDTLDVGGGFPVDPDRPEPTAADFVTDLQGALAGSGLQLPARRIVEPGRGLVAAAGSIVARVLHVRRRDWGQQVVIDAGMTELLRPALYGAAHPIRALATPDREDLLDTVVDGPVCESADTFGRYRLPALRRGDLVAVGHTGAYGSVLASMYNGRPIAAEVFVEPDGRMAVVREAVPPEALDVSVSSPRCPRT